jgi:outer membrane receptor for ferrienterochelin and colicins
MLTQSTRFPFSLIFTATVFLHLSLVPLDAQAGLPSEFKDFEEVSLESFTDMVIVTASKHEQRLSEAPAYVTVITSEMIEDYGFETVAEALQVVPGMHVSYDKNFHIIGVRGVGLQGDWNTRVQLLLNGHLLNEQWNGTASVGELVGLNMEEIDRIEVVKGAGSSLYGSCAFLATINIITKKPDGRGEMNLVGKYTPHSNRKGTGLSFSKALSNGLEVNLSTSIEGVGGARLFFPEYSNFDLSMFEPDDEGLSQYYLTVDDFTGGYTSETDFMRARHLFGQLRWGDWTLWGKLSTRKKGTPTGFYGSLFNDKRNWVKEDYNFLELKFQRHLSESIDFTSRVHYDDYYFINHVSYNYYVLEDDPPYLPGPVWGDVGVDDFWGGEARFDWQITPWERLILGGVYESHRIHQHSGELDSTLTRIQEEWGPEGIRDIDFDFWDLYFQNELKLGAKIALVGAGNYSKRHYSESFFAPKAAVILTDKRLGVLKGIYGQAFRAPSIFEFTFDDGVTFIGNPDLVHEQVNTGEIVYERFFGGGVRVSISGYEGMAKNLITTREVYAGDPGHPGDPYEDLLFQYYNLDEIEFRGMEFGLEKQTRGGCSGFFNFGIQSVKDAKTKQTPPNSPHFLANFGVSVPLWRNKVRSSVSGRYLDERKAYDGQVAKSYFTSDLWLHLKNVVPGLSVRAGVKNLLDTDIIDPIFEDYYPVVLLKQDGRRLILKVDYTLGI